MLRAATLCVCKVAIRIRCRLNLKFILFSHECYLTSGGCCAIIEASKERKGTIMKKHLIWSNYNLDYEDEREWMEEEYPELTEDKRIEKMYELNADNLEEERCNLDIQMPEAILAIADLGLWYGRRTGYKEITSRRISDCLYSDRDTEYATWWVDGRGDLCAEFIHHDGRNYITYREWKEGISETQKENLKAKLMRGEATRKDITRKTRKLGDRIAAVYT